MGTRYPVEAPEGILNRTIGGHLVSGVLSVTEIEVLDLLSEGEIDGLVRGYYDFEVPATQKGTAGNVGWNSAIFTEYKPPSDSSSTFLKSIYWNETPLINTNHNPPQYNYQSIDVSFTPGLPNGPDESFKSTPLTVSRTLGERLRATEIDSDQSGNPIGTDNNYVKVYRIFNKECIAATINVKVGQLSTTIITSHEIDLDGKHYYGDTLTTEIIYNIYKRPIFSNPGLDINRPEKTKFKLFTKESIKGKVTYGYIRSTRVDFSPAPDDSDFIGWELKVIRITPDSVTSNLRNQTFIDSITEEYADNYSYPNSAIVRQKFNAQFFAQVPARAFDCKLLKVKIPNNYDSIKKTYGDSDIGTTDGDQGSDHWDGQFKENKEWTDNPAWCFYDILTNQRYGLGKYITEESVDKWTLYEIAKYCDTLVPDGEGGLEPRFSCNILINSREEAYKVINDFASIFRALTYYGGGSIYAIQDSPKPPLVQFTNANVENGDFNYQNSSKKTRHTVAIVRYNDKSNFYKPAIEYVEDTDGIKQYGIRELDLTAFGCTSRGQAIRFGRWALLSETTETETVTFTAGMEGAYLRPGDVFKVFDSNRKTKRMGGRVTNVETSEDNLGKTNQIIFTLDSLLGTDYTQVLPTNEYVSKYNFSILTPSYSYDASLVSDLSNKDAKNIRKSFLQSGLINSSSLSTNSDNKTKVTIDINNIPPSDVYFDLINPSFDNNSVWTIEYTGDTTTLLQSNSFIDKSFDYYRTLRITEKDDVKYEVFGLQYNEKKYLAIESGLNFVAPKVLLSTQTDVGYNVANYNISPFLSKPVQGFPKISYFFTVGDYKDITSFNVYTKKGTFDAGLPSDEYLTDVLPATATDGEFIPNLDGTWSIRIHAVRSNAGVDSNVFGESSIEVSNTSPIKNVIISSLQLENLSTGNANASRQSGIFDSLSPSFSWQVGFQNENPLPLDLSYRVTYRKPSNTNVPDPTIYYEVTGLQFATGNFTHTFDFGVNKALNQGPYREFDIVVEGMDASGRTSADNVLNPLTETWANTRGYDIFYANNPRPSGILLNSPESGYSSRQWFDAHGSINVKYNSGQLPSDLKGGFVYASTGLFTKNQIISGNSSISTGEFKYDSGNKSLSSPINVMGGNTGWIALSFYDSFDEQRKNNGTNIFYGVSGSGWCLDITNIVPVVSSGSLNNLQLTEKLDIHNWGYFGEFVSYRVDRFVSGSLNYVVSKGIDEFGNESILNTRTVQMPSMNRIYGISRISISPKKTIQGKGNIVPYRYKSINGKAYITQNIS